MKNPLAGKKNPEIKPVPAIPIIPQTKPEINPSPEKHDDPPKPEIIPEPERKTEPGKETGNF